MTDKKTESTAPSAALAVPTPQAMEAAPSYITKSRRGFEDTVQSDITIPRLALAQALSPQVTDGDPARRATEDGGGGTYAACSPNCRAPSP